MSHNKLKISISLLLSLLCFVSAGQFWDGSSGLLQAPSADMNRDGTFTITNNFLNKNSLSPAWGYHTFGYGIGITLWSRIELGYNLVIFDGKRHPNPSERDLITFNQDRHFSVKALLIKENDFNLSWMPAIAIGASDPITGSWSGEYGESGNDSGGNGFFNRYYFVATKHYATKIGIIGAHIGYQFNKRQDIHYNGPCVAVDWIPVWLNKPNFSLKAIAEYDSRTFNLGFIASIWQNRFEAMFELMALKWVNFGVRFNLPLKA